MEANVSEIIPYAVNFGIVVVLLVVLARKPLRRFVYQRHEHLKDFLEESARVHEKSSARHSLAEKNLNGAEQEAKNLLAQEIAAAKQEAASLLQKADAEVIRVSKETERLIESQGSDVNDRVRAQFVDLVVKNTEEKLKAGLKSDDHSAIFKRARSSIEVGV